MRSPVLAVSVLVLVAVAARHGARAVAEEAGYPVGDSTQELEGVSFNLRVPAKAGADGKYGLFLVLPGGLSDLDPLSGTPYLVVQPFVPTSRASGLWRASEAKAIVAVVRRVMKQYPVDPKRVHAVAIEQTSLHGIFEMATVGKKSPFVSLCYVRSRALRTSYPSTAKKRVGVLAFDWDSPPRKGEGVKEIVETLTGKVKRVELRGDPDEIAGPYFRYWHFVMGGECTPGYDHSLRWIDEVTSLEVLRTEIKDGGRGGLLYLHEAAEGKPSGETVHLQNDVFFDPSVRREAEAVPAYKLDGKVHAALMSPLGLKRLPAVVLFARDGAIAARFEGKVKARSLAKALSKIRKTKPK